MVGPVLSRALWTGRKLTISTIRNQFQTTKRNLETMPASLLTFLEPEKIPENRIHCSDPYALVHDDVKDTLADIKTELTSSNIHLNEMFSYYFDGQNKSRMSVILLMAKAVNNHAYGCESILLPKQRQVTMVAEMIHVGARLHKMCGVGVNEDNFADNSALQIGGKEILLGDFILCSVLVLLARIGHNAVYGGMSKIIGDQVKGEFMQDNTLSMIGSEDETLSRYLVKAFNTTGSLMAASCKAVTILSGAKPHIQNVAFEFGKNAGISYQIAEDAEKLALFGNSKSVLVEGDTHSYSREIFSSPEMNEMIENLKFLGHQHCVNAIRILDDIRACPEKEALISLTNIFAKTS